MLPDPLINLAGSPVTSSEAWLEQRRSEILELFQEHVYGRMPNAQVSQTYDVFDTDESALDGRAIRKQVAIELAGKGKRLRIDLLLYLPASAKTTPAPVFCMLNFFGNHTVNPDPAIVLPEDYVDKTQSPDEHGRGSGAGRFPVDRMLARGYGLATAYCGDIDPDRDDGFHNGIHPLYDAAAKERSPDAWGTVGGWASGLSRMMDYLVTDPQVDSSRVIVSGLSRLGKTSLWAGAQDTRFAMVVSNCSGCTGAAMSRRKHGETVKAINERFPHWFCGNYEQYNDREEALPVDQHMLLALVAPRPLYVASATEDDWADPEGEFQACVLADPVYRLWGLGGMGTADMPDPDSPLLEGQIGYHIRTGRHNLTAYDWERHMDFADRHLHG